MMYLRWLFVTLFAIATTLLSIPLTPIAVLLADTKNGRLSWIFRWMETPDCALPGDPNHVGKPSTRLGWYWASMRWLWRNPAYRATDWAKFIPAVVDHAPGHQTIFGFNNVRGDKEITETPFRGGYFYAEMDDGVRSVFEFYGLWKWPGIDKCVRLRLGWKLKPWFQGKPYIPTDVDGMHVISFNPWMGCN